MHAREAIGAVHMPAAAICEACGTLADPACTRAGCQAIVCERAEMATRGESSARASNAAALPLHFSAHPSGGVPENCEAEKLGG